MLIHWHWTQPIALQLMFEVNLAPSDTSQPSVLGKLVNTLAWCLQATVNSKITHKTHKNMKNLALTRLQKGHWVTGRAESRRRSLAVLPLRGRRPGQLQSVALHIPRMTKRCHKCCFGLLINCYKWQIQIGNPQIMRITWVNSQGGSLHPFFSPVKSGAQAAAGCTWMRSSRCRLACSSFFCRISSSFARCCSRCSFRM